ncbi:HAD family hydrolase [Gilvimarinus algae]|uniref:HAD family hydrolase n=1 Tax=Gilvimarinus algae TaxID=3058037 RepID=A0ABT8TFR6_9GAMM|nr:HAD family hydrolase [Gilvimarinus sp. SDUM040014]MDO3381943.1 HAD family hydrolase [Gilvimarinus sp. SDUM040014]
MLVIFDCDGVLVDTETVSARVLRDCLKPLGVHITISEVFALFRGKSIAVCADQVAALLADSEPYCSWPVNERDDFAREFWSKVQTETLRAFEAGVEPIDGVKALLQSLRERNIAFCVASNGRHEKMRLSLTQAGLIDYFPSHRFSATDVAEGKPAPDLFLYAAQKMKVLPADCVVIEDSPSGARAARLAGMKLFGYCPPDDTGQVDRRTQKLLEQEGAQLFRHMDELLGM